MCGTTLSQTACVIKMIDCGVKAKGWASEGGGGGGEGRGRWGGG